MKTQPTTQLLASPPLPAPTGSAINIIFDGPPGPESGRFVEVETDDGHSINAGEWCQRLDGLWALRITRLPNAAGEPQPREPRT
jgi:hypothetical protein